jgi:hypothetical protein
MDGLNRKRYIRNPTLIESTIYISLIKPYYPHPFMKFNVRVNSTYSDIQEQEMGIPQGSILSVTLFSIKINSLAKVVNDNIDGSHGVER